MTSYNMDNRDEVHELEFLSLLAFVAREAMSFKGISSSKANKFSPSDMEMAYAFHNKFGQQHQIHQRTENALPFLKPTDTEFQQVSPSHSQNTQIHPHYMLDTSPRHLSTGVHGGQHNTQQTLDLAGQESYGMVPQRYIAVNLQGYGTQDPQSLQRSSTGQVLNQSGRRDEPFRDYSMQPVSHQQQMVREGDTLGFSNSSWMPQSHQEVREGDTLGFSNSSWMPQSHQEVTEREFVRSQNREQRSMVSSSGMPMGRNDGGQLQPLMESSRETGRRSGEPLPNY